MRFPSPLRGGRLIRRYKRFLADIAFDDGQEATVHVPNPGAMLGLNHPGLRVWASQSRSKTRKLPLTLELVEIDGGLVGVNTLHPNRLVGEALAAGAIPELAGYEAHRAEVAYGTRSRIDFLLSCADRPKCWLEIKNVHLSRTAGLAEFPDCIAARSLKHLGELEIMAAAGDRAVVLFIVQRSDCSAFEAAADLDPAFAAGLVRAAANGVEVLVYACDLTLDAITIATRTPWRGG